MQNFMWLEKVDYIDIVSMNVGGENRAPIFICKNSLYKDHRLKLDKTVYQITLGY